MLDSNQIVLKHIMFLKYNEYKRLYNNLCLKIAFVFVYINKSHGNNDCNAIYGTTTATLI